MATNSAINLGTAASGKLVQAKGVGVANDFTTATYPATATGTGGTPTWAVNVGGVTLHPTGSAQQIRQVEGCAVVVAQASSSWR